MCGNSQGCGVWVSGYQKEESDGGSDKGKLNTKRASFLMEEQEQREGRAGSNGKASITTPPFPRSTPEGAS